MIGRQVPQALIAGAALLWLIAGGAAPAVAQTVVAPCTTIITAGGDQNCQRVTASAPLPVTVSGGSGSTTTVLPSAAASTDISGTVTAGGSYQTVAAASDARKNCTVQNPTTATEPLSVKIGAMAQPYTLAPGQALSALNGTVVATDAITATATTTGHAFAGTCQ